jgi:hypothetical protein
VAASRQSVEHFLAAGVALLKAKERLGHGRQPRGEGFE